MESEQDLIVTVAVAVAVPFLPPLPPPPLQPFIFQRRRKRQKENLLLQKQILFPQCFFQVTVRLGDNADHYYVLSRFLLSRMLTVTKIPNHVAIKIALELKKLLIDNSLQDVYALFGNYFSGSIPEWIGQKKNLQFLDFSQNLFYKTIPSNLGDVVRMTRYWEKFISLSF
ncbi:uncharacterized protein LOC110270317 [Arachis ipaensis]|uniref:uncharacterized protein LOC110270317 n=1 Tax=Arachis ipaensis TaxID=130454 RepID=UPI000A2B8BE7|nr:uncharacterized protein LOC110270317 [Arachis ipaensis]